MFKIDNEIEFYPKMIESLYIFLLQNDKYKKVEIGNSVIFKGDICDCFEAIRFARK